MVTPLRSSTKSLAIRLAGSFGVHLSRQTSRSQLYELIESLHPIDSGVELTRVGPPGDGGYLIPDDLGGIEYVFSPGVAAESGFEEDLANRGMTIFMADRSVSGPTIHNERFNFVPKFVGSLNTNGDMTLDAWKSDSIGGYPGDLLLQMDIEGGEYETLLCTSDLLLSQFRILVIEFHNLRELFGRPFFDLVSVVFRRLLQTHTVVHIHPNNNDGIVSGLGIDIPRVAEITFLRNDRVRQREFRRDFPHRLDAENTSGPPIVLPPAWFRSASDS